MITRFEVKNFKNFSDTLVFDLGQPNSYEFNEECVVDGVVSKAMIYGQNAVGKSNLGFAMLDISTHVTDKFRSEWNYSNYLNADCKCEYAEFKYNFKFKSGTVVYTYWKSSIETLVYEHLEINGSHYASIDRRKDSQLNISASGAESLRRDLSDSIVSIIPYIKNNTVLDGGVDNSCFGEFLGFVEGMLFFRSLEANNYIGYEQGSTKIDADIIEKGNTKNFEKFLIKAGVDCRLEEVHGDEKPYLVFAFADRRIRFFEIASQGTRALALFYYWLQRLKEDNTKVSFVFIDEFDAFYHHALSTVMVELLKEIKPQVILTTHNTSIMTNDLLRPDCYFFIRKNGIQSLSDSTQKELREAHNIEKMYKAGAFND